MQIFGQKSAFFVSFGLKRGKELLIRPKLSKIIPKLLVALGTLEAIVNYFSLRIEEMSVTLDVEDAVDEDLLAVGFCRSDLAVNFVQSCTGIFDGYLKGLALCPIADGVAFSVRTADEPVDGKGSRSELVLFLDGGEQRRNDIEGHGVLREEFVLADGV